MSSFPPSFSAGGSSRKIGLWLSLAILYVGIVIGIGRHSDLEPPNEALGVADESLTRRKNPLKRLWKFARSLPASKAPRRARSSEFKHAASHPPKLKPKEKQIMLEFSRRVHEAIPDLPRRAPAVHFGGQPSVQWWSPTGNHTRFSKYDLEKTDGASLLWSYYVIMRLYMKNPDDLSQTTFPFRLCKHGCTAETAIAHSIQWRESYQPWMVTDAALKENQFGWLYARGFSVPSPHGRHGMVFCRPGKHKVRDPMAYFRVLFHAIEKAIADALYHSHGRVGKFNILIDCTDYQFSRMPDIAYVKQHIIMLQDHYPNRLGVVAMTNVSRTAEIFIKIIKQIITKEVRDKIIVLSHDEDKRQEQLGALIDKDYIPDWLGGPDTFHFDPDHYYPRRHRFGDAEGAAFLDALPRHTT